MEPSPKDARRVGPPSGSVEPPRANPLAIEVRGLVAERPGKRILHGVDFEARPGALIGLIGLNGAGKTSLVKAILALDQHCSGTIRLFGRDRKEPEARRPIAYLPERFRAPEAFTGMEFLEASSRLRGVSIDRARAEAEIDALRLATTALDQRIGGYSKGMTQKLGLAASFASRAPFLILDEPMSGLDPRARIAFKRKLLAHKSAGGGALLCSHVLSDLEEIADRIAVMHGGRLVFQGPPAELKGDAPSLEEAFLRRIEREEEPMPAAA